MKLTELTVEQWYAVKTYRREMLTLGRCTDPIDRPSAENTFKEIYKVLLGKKLSKVLWVDGLTEAKNLFDKRKVSTQNMWNECRWGGFELHWAAYSTFVAGLPGVEVTKNIRELLALWMETSKCHIWWPRKTVVVACERPKTIVTNERGFLSCTTGAAIEYRDGTAFYFLEGVKVPMEVVTEPQNLTMKSISSERNAEVRRLMIKQYGLPRYLKDTGAKLLDSVRGEKLFEDKDNARFLICTDGSTGKIYELTVPPDTTTCKEAQESLSGLSFDKIIGGS